MLFVLTIYTFDSTKNWLITEDRIEWLNTCKENICLLQLLICLDIKLKIEVIDLDNGFKENFKQDLWI